MRNPDIRNSPRRGRGSIRTVIDRQIANPVAMRA